MLYTDSCQTKEQCMLFLFAKFYWGDHIRCRRIFSCVLLVIRRLSIVKHNEVIHLLDDFDTDDYEPRIIQELYYSQSAKVREREIIRRILRRKGCSTRLCLLSWSFLAVQWKDTRCPWWNASCTIKWSEYQLSEVCRRHCPHCTVATWFSSSAN